MKIDLNKIDIVINCKDELIINSYPEYFTVIIKNLISNSFLHGFKGKDKGKITIDINLNNSNLTLIYKDNGKGVSPKLTNKVFDEFYTTKKGEGGTGLGLYIVKTIVENKLNGTISFQSELGKGVEIKIIFPLD